MIHTKPRWSVPAIGAAAILTVVLATPSGAGSGHALPVRAVPAGAASPTSGLPPVPKVNVLRNRPGTAPGMFFTTPQNPNDLAVPHGPTIVDGKGRPVWFRPIPAGEIATDLRVQTYQGRKVITWWQGEHVNVGAGRGVGYIADENYRVIATVKGSSGPADLHEFRLTSRGTALLTLYPQVQRDLTAVGGPKDGTVFDGVVEEIDIATGRLLWRWSSLDHVPISETDLPYAARPDGAPYDYFHINSIDEDAEGDLLVSGRFVSTVFKIDRQTGKIEWRLGGRRSSFPLGIGVRFSWQHDAVWAGKDTIKLFDNGTLFLWDGYESRVAWIKVNPGRKTTRLVKQVTHPEHLSTIQEGNAQGLPNGNTAVSWGPTGRISEFSKGGKLLFDAALDKNWSTYRIFRSPWRAKPESAPIAVAQGGTVHAVWNGATGVARWRLYAGTAQNAMEPIAETAWNGLDTAIALPAAATSATYVKVEALDAQGKPLGSSNAAPRTGR
ncbi:MULTISPECIES: arylsulfotransferase family protein [Thermomonosporaceae]|uniref:arylsulfotransferase family protein n=1 Tax=Thermomonosporaceae TaxID=2012 RepID=UPI00255B3C61|nr:MULTISPECIES: arylsulfotransferase family protein [Thermomonosporaceae]MDL4774226.1 arylsulfotransferase family protein [Actinomadura xylanilytica]